MPRLKEADFYYGAVLSGLFNNGIHPALIEGGNDRQVYEFTTNKKSFLLFVKYRSRPIGTITPGYSSWQFTFCEKDILELNKYIKGAKHLSLGLICGNEQLKKSEFAVLNKQDIQEILNAGKDSLTISRKTGERAYRIPIVGGRVNALQIRMNRWF